MMSIKRRPWLSIMLLTLSVSLSGCEILGPSRPGSVTAYAPAFEAASRGDVATVSDAIAAKPSLVRKTEWGGNTLLHDAVEKGRQDVAALLLNQKADANARNDNGFTPLHVAAQNGDLPMIRLLLAHGAGVRIFDKRGRTPADIATAWNQADAAALLHAEAGKGHR